MHLAAGLQEVLLQQNVGVDVRQQRGIGILPRDAENVAEKRRPVGVALHLADIADAERLRVLLHALIVPDQQNVNIPAEHLPGTDGVALDDGDVFTVEAFRRNKNRYKAHVI